VRALVEGARDRLGEAIGACREDVFFVSGGTEAVHAPLSGARLADGNIALVVSAIEHDAVSALAPGQLRFGVLSSGVADLIHLEETVRMTAESGRRPLVSLMMVNNETGVVQPVAAAAEIAHRYGGWLHCDAAQALGRIEISVEDLGADYLSVSSHKIGGPRGVGGCFVRPGAPYAALARGGGQETGRRAGSEAVEAISGFGAALAACVRDIPAYEAWRARRDAMEHRIRRACPQLRVFGSDAPRVAGVSCFGIDGLPAETQIIALDLAGFALSAGAACSSGKVRTSAVLSAMGVGETLARCAVRASFGWGNDTTDADRLAAAWVGLVRRMRPGAVAEEAVADD
jgi:cysteine desulfurase